MSRAIRQLEQRLGVELFERTSRKVLLTEAGDVLLHEAGKALDAVAAAARRTQRVAEPKLVLVMKPGSGGGMLQDILDRHATEPDALPAELLVCGIGEQAQILRDGRADVAVLHLPYDDTSGFDIEQLRVEGAVAILPAGHRYADRDRLWMADLEGELLPRWPGMTGTGPEVRDAAQLMQLIAIGRVIAVLPESARIGLRGDLVAVYVVDGPISTIAVGWPERSSSRAVAASVRAAIAVAESEIRPPVAGAASGRVPSSGTPRPSG